MSDLKERQAAFMRAILDDGTPLPDGWGNSQAAGMAVYRGNYRSALIGALENTFERTRAFVGEAAFKQAAINHAIARPPHGWTIDEAGSGFDATCAGFFKDNPEVADLAWLEWAMLDVSSAADLETMTPEAFAAATAEFGDEEWMELRVAMQPRAAARVTRTNLTGLWNSLGGAGGDERPEPRLTKPRGCIVAREGELPTFQMVEPANAEVFVMMRGGASYGEVIAAMAGEDPDAEAFQNAAMRAGALLGEWLKDGLIVGLADKQHT